MGVNFGGFLIRTPGHTWSSSTPGSAAARSRSSPIGSLPERLADAGVAPSDVDTVIFTHLHFDHVGWSTTASNRCSPPPSTTRTRSTGPTTGSGRARRRPAPAARTSAPSRRPSGSRRSRDSIVLHAGERTEIVPGVTLRLAPGHTPGPLHRRDRSHGERAVLLADAAHNPAQLAQRRLALGHRRRRRARAAHARGAGGRARGQRDADHDDPRRRQPLRPARAEAGGRRWAYAPSIE